MVYLVIKQTTKNDIAWKEAFDQFFEYRRIGGEISCEIYKTPGKRNELTILSKWNSIENVNDFLQSQSFEMIKELEKEEPISIQLMRGNAG